MSAALVVLMLRARGVFWRSRPSRAPGLATLAVAVATIALPYTPLGAAFGFAPLCWVFLALMGLIVSGYIGSAEILKRRFYRAPNQNVGVSR